jgi:hypothetical protein
MRQFTDWNHRCAKLSQSKIQNGITCLQQAGNSDKSTAMKSYEKL